MQVGYHRLPVVLLECKYLEDDETPYISIGQFETFPTEVLNWKSFEQDTLEIAGFSINCCQVYVEIYNGTLGSTEIYNKNLNSFIIDWSGNPFVDGRWQYRENADGDHNTVDIMNYALEFMKKVPIKPFSGTYHGEKRFKLGQCITIIDEDGSSYNTVLTRIQWNFRGGYELKCSGKDNRTLFDSARRTPSVRAKEQALTKSNYAIKQVENVIADVDNRLSSEVQDAQGQTMDVQSAVNYAHERIDSAEITIEKLSNRITALEGLHGITS